jgi:hypothetical protein
MTNRESLIAAIEAQDRDAILFFKDACLAELDQIAAINQGETYTADQRTLA